ncbi:MAG TPA: HAD-IA family hydrolase [Sandaracinaceae bacterium LLY-WYZ-13_1]|nr:HAD-IA family hydrolase [Sandaracinaceae bacterium LLY-WYZ-13_1]
MPRHDAVLFDLDGTLLDSVALILESYRHTLAAHGLAPRSREEILEGLGTPLEAQLGRWAPADRIEALIDTYVEHNLRVHDELVRPFEGVNAIVHALREAGTPLAIVTSKRRRGTTQGLAALGLSDAFDTWVCADDVARPKPHPEPVERALAVLGVGPERAVFVGDATHDVHAGRAAGVRTVAVLWGSGSRDALAAAAPDDWAGDAAELERLLL